MKNYLKNLTKEVIALFLFLFSFNAFSQSVEILNHSFELVDLNYYPVNWSPSHSPESSLSCADKYYIGEKSLKLIDTDSDISVGVRSDNIEDVIVGRYYHTSVRCFLESGTARIYLEFRDNSGNRIHHEYSDLNIQGSWEKLEVTGQAPVNTDYITILLYSTKANTGISYYDDVTLSEGHNIPNGNFEQTVDNFAQFWEKTFETSYISLNSNPQNSYLGSNSIEINDISADYAAGVRSSKFSNISNYDMYNAEVLCKVVSGTARLYLEFRDENEVRISEVHKEISSSADWQKISVSSTAPAKTSYITIALYSTQSNVGTVYFDNVNLNVLKDYSFEKTNQDLTFSEYWTITAHNPSAVFADYENAYASYHNIKIYDEDSNRGAGVRSSKIVNITPNSYYNASAKVYVESGTVSIYLQYRDKNDNVIYDVHEESSVTNAFQTINVSALAPVNSSYATISLYSSISNIGKSYIDHITLGEEILNIGDRKQLFIDDYIIENTFNVERKFHKGEKVYKGVNDPLIDTTEAWEKNAGISLFGNVLHKDGLYKMWYRSYPDKICYATSSDGLNWNKPNLNLISYNGDNNNNIIKFMKNAFEEEDGHIEIVSVVWDDFYNKYFMYAQNEFTSSEQWYKVYESTDGLTWTKVMIHKTYTTTDQWYDVCTMAPDFYNNQYVLGYKKVDSSVGPGRIHFNAIVDDLYDPTSIAEDVYMYGLADRIDDAYSHTLSENSRGADSYGMGLFPYEGVYIGFNWQFYITDRIEVNGKYRHEGPIIPQLLFSRDLKKQWQRPDREALIDLGDSTINEFDDGMISTASYPLIDGDSIKLYYGGWDGTHAVSGGDRIARIGMAKWRLDGFASMENHTLIGPIPDKHISDESLEEIYKPLPGILNTRKFISNGEFLTLNADASYENSRITIHVYDENGNLMRTSNPITSNNVQHVVAWNTIYDNTPLDNKTISLRIFVANAKLYSFQFTDELINRSKSSEYTPINQPEKIGNLNTQEDELFKSNLTVYPNPTNSLVTISNIPENASLILTNMQGQVILNVKNDSSQFKIDLSGYPNGMYIITVRYDGELITQRIIKK